MICFPLQMLLDVEKSAVRFGAAKIAMIEGEYNEQIKTWNEN